MKWFGRKSAGRALPRPALLRSLVAAGFGEWPRSYEAQVREGYLENAIAQRAVRLVAEGVASGNGTNRPRGILNGTQSTNDDASRTFGQLQYIATGVSGAFPATNPADKLVEFVHKLRSPYRQGASWVMNSTTLTAIRKFKTNDGAFVWQPALANGQPDTLLGYPVVEAEDIAPLSDDLGASADGKRVARIEREKLPFDALPRRRTVSYYDVARDYQQGSQSLFRPDFGARERRIDFAASLTPERARALIERKTLTDAAARDRIKIALPWRYARAAPGEALSLPGVQGRWLIAETRLEGMTVRAELERLPDGAAGSPGAEPGRAVGEVDAEHGPTVLRIIELPWLGSGVATSPALYAVAAGSMAGWRRAALLQSNDDGASFEEIGATAPPAVMGSAVTVLATGTAFGFDRVGAVEVDLLHAGMTVGPATEDALIGGANLAMLGDELIQFAVAEKIGPVRYRLSGLLRGRRGTEWAVSSHIVGEDFTLIESDALLPLVVPDGVASVTLTASGVGDAVAVSASAPVGGASLRPPAPVKLRPTALANGDTRVEWVRRSRDGWRWADHVDAPLGEESEAYEVVVTPQPGASRIVTLNSPEWTYTAAERAADVGGGATSLSVDICQIGTRGRSKAASTSLSLV